MRNLGILVGVMLAVSAVGTAVAADPAAPKKEFSEKQLAQQQRMKDCSAEAKTKALKGDDRKAFMKTCLSGGSVTAEAGAATASAPPEATPASDKRAEQKAKMKNCNAEAKAKALKGDERKTFMSSCLSG